MAKKSVQKTTVFAGIAVAQEEVEEVNSWHRQNAEAVEESLIRSARIGHKLKQWKEQFPKRAPEGQGFETWVEKNFHFTGRMARNYIRIFENRHLLGQHTTIAGFLDSISTPKKPTNTETISGIVTGEESSSTENQGQAVGATWQEEGSPEVALEPKDEKKALALAEFFGVDLNKARNWVQSKKRQPKPKKKRDKSKLVPVTIRFTYDEVDIMEKVARKNKLPFAEVAREHHKLGTRAFAKKYGFE